VGSTSTKNPAYPDTLYVDELIGPETVNTLRPETVKAFIDHGQAAETSRGTWKAPADRSGAWRSSASTSTPSPAGSRRKG